MYVSEYLFKSFFSYKPNNLETVNLDHQTTKGCCCPLKRYSWAFSGENCLFFIPHPNIACRSNLCCCK